MAYQLCLLAIADVIRELMKLFSCVPHVMLDLDIQPIGLFTVTSSDTGLWHCQLETRDLVHKGDLVMHTKQPDTLHALTPLCHQNQRTFVSKFALRKILCCCYTQV